MLKVTQTLEITQITHTEIFSYHEDETNAHPNESTNRRIQTVSQMQIFWRVGLAHDLDQL